MGISIPLFGALMSGKSQNLYTSVLSFMQGLWPEFLPDEIMVDFERGLKNALCEVWTQAAVRGCRFHFSQACIRMVGKKGLKRDFRNNTRVKSWIKGSLGLCLLPADSIKEEWRKHCLKLEQFQGNLILSKKMNNYKQYIDSYWIDTVGVESFSVFGASHKTNNNAESLNSRLGKIFKIKHPGFWTFMDLYKKNLINHTTDDLANLLKGRLPRRSRKEDSNSAKIKNYEQKVISGEWSAEHYLKVASNLFSKFSVPDVEEEEDEEVLDVFLDVLEVDQFDEQQLTQDQIHSVLCVVCTDRLKDCLLQPCFHWTMCHLCALELQSNAPDGHNPICPVCKTPFSGFIQPRNAIN